MKPKRIDHALRGFIQQGKGPWAKIAIPEASKFIAELCNDEFATAQEQLAEMRGAILDVEEWIANDQHQPEYYCAFCGNQEDEGHATNCARQKALSAMKEQN